MEEEFEEGQEPVKEIPEPPGKKFFVSHLNSYTGRILLQELRNELLVKDPAAAHTFIGTLYKDESYDTTHPDLVPNGVQKLIYMERAKEFREELLSCDVIVYDLLTNSYEEVDYVIKTLKSAPLQTEKRLILISTVMTWSNTPLKYKKELEEGEEAAEGEEEEEEEPEEEEAAAENQEMDENGEPIKKPKPVFYKEDDRFMRVAAPE
jgi:hypothetical protein